jgi:Ca2+-binding EF-hand superfamily protein
MHTKKAHEIRHAKRDEQVATPPNKNPTWKRIMTPPMRSPMLRRIRESPLANVKGHFDHLRHFERMANQQAMKKHTKFVPLLPPGTASSTGSRPMSTHSFDSVSSAADFIYHKKKPYVPTPEEPRYARNPDQAKTLDARNLKWTNAQPRADCETPSDIGSENYSYTSSKKKFVDQAPHLVPLPWERAYKPEQSDHRLTLEQQAAVEKQLENSAKLLSPREIMHQPLQVIKALRQKMTAQDNGATKIIKVFKQFDIGGNSGGTKDDNLLDVEEVQNGLNNLLHLKLTKDEAKNVMKLVDQNGDGKLSIEEFLYAAKSDDIANRIIEADLMMPRQIISPEKRRRAYKRKIMKGIIQKDNIPNHLTGVETAFIRRKKKAQQMKQFRRAYHQPWKVLKRLREGITMKNIIKTFKLMDVGNQGVQQQETKYEKEAERLIQEEVRVKVGKDYKNHDLDRTVGYNDLLDKREIKNGLNRFLNLNMNDEEIDAVMEVIDKNKDGELSFGELFEAIAGPEIEGYIEQNLRTAKRYLLPDDHLKKFKITGKITARKDDEMLGDAHPLQELSVLDEQRLNPSKIATMCDRDLHPNKASSVNWLDEKNPEAPGYMDVHHTKKKRYPPTLFIKYDPKVHKERPPKEWYQRADEVDGWHVPIQHGDHGNMMKIAKQTDCINPNGNTDTDTRPLRTRPSQRQKRSQLEFAFSPVAKLDYKIPPRGTSPCVW